jgi:uncharacterized protein
MRYIFLFLMGAAACTGPSHEKNLHVLVVAGGHAFDTLAFHAVFDGMEGIEVETAMQPEANRLIASDRANAFDAIVFYDSWQAISEAEKQAYLDLPERGTGMVFLHHALVSYQHWPAFTEIRGGKYRHPENYPDPGLASDYRHDITMHIVTHPGHPITDGIGPFDIYDEGYMNLEVLPSVDVLLTTNHDYCHEVIGWAHQVQNARIVYLLPGHAAPGLENKSYRQIIENAIKWVGKPSH